VIPSREAATKGGTVESAVSRPPRDRKRRRSKGRGGGGNATRCRLERRIAKSLERRTAATSLHMATPKEDRYPHQSRISLVFPSSFPRLSLRHTVSPWTRYSRLFLPRSRRIHPNVRRARAAASFEPPPRCVSVFSICRKSGR
jgi:hypothetical protein